MDLDRVEVVFGTARFGSQDPDDPVAVAHRGNLGVGYGARAGGERESGDRTVLDPGRAVADDIVEVFLQLVEHPLDPVPLQRFLVPPLRRREDVKVVVAVIPDQCVVELSVAVDDIDEIEHNAAFAPHDQVEVAQPDIEVDNDSPLAAQSQPGGDRGCGGGLADASLARSEHDYFGQTDLPLLPQQTPCDGFAAVPAARASAASMLNVNFARWSTDHRRARSAPVNPGAPAEFDR